MAVRVARGLNKQWQRKGKVFADRYHARILRSPKEVRGALLYVLNNSRKHSATVRVVRWYKKSWVDTGCTSAEYFHGWRARSHREPGERDPVVAPQTWLCRTGWLEHHGRIASDEAPGRAALEAQRRALAKAAEPPAPHLAALRHEARTKHGAPLPRDEDYFMALF